MKPAALLAAFLVVVSASAQGLVNFANSSTTLIYTQSIFGITGAISGVNAYRIGLWAGPLGSPAASLTLVGLATNSSIVAGRFASAFPFMLPTGYPVGTTITFQVRAWEAAAGSWEAAEASGDQYGNGGFLRGASTLGSVTPADGSSIPIIPSLFGTEPGQVGGFLVTSPIPEPTVPGLSAVCLAVLFFSCYAKRRSKPKVSR